MNSLREEILEECVNAEAVRINKIIDIAISVFEKRIDEMIKVAYKKDPVSVWPLTQVKEMLNAKE